MGTLRKVALGVLLISFLTFVAFFGRLPAFRNTPVQFLHRLIWIHLPNTVRRLDDKFTGGRLASSTGRLGNYLFYEKHPLVLVFFLGTLTISSTLFLYTTWTSLPTHHHILLPIVLPTPYILTYLCATSTTSHITASNHERQMRYYPYDNVLYHPGFRCRTCNFQKPARSKHCSICKTCIAKADHHCAWVNNCLGRGNYHLFILLLFCTGLLLAYGAFLSYVFLSPWLPHLPHFPIPIFRPEEPWRASDWSTYFNDLSRTISAQPVPTAVGLLAFFTAPLACGLLTYHIYLIWAGMTTNETSKWGDLKDDMTEGFCFKAKRSVIYPNMQFNFDREEPKTEWPVNSDQVVVRTVDGLPPGRRGTHRVLKCEEAVTSDYETDGKWKRCWLLSEVDNIYDLGFRDNVKDVFVGVT